MPAKLTPIRLIVGLGNPGDEYRSTRHNMGFWFLDELAREKGVRFSSDARFFGDTARLTTPEGDVWLLKPTTYMNASGSAVQALAAYYKIKPEEILVVHDELDIAPGCLKVKLGGGNAGHNGLKDRETLHAELLAPSDRDRSPARLLPAATGVRLGVGLPIFRTRKRHPPDDCRSA